MKSVLFDVKFWVVEELGRVKTRLLEAYARRKGVFLGAVTGKKYGQFAFVVTILPPNGRVQPCVALNPCVTTDQDDMIGEGMRQDLRVHRLDPLEAFLSPIDEGIAQIYLATQVLERELQKPPQEHAEPAPPPVH